MKQLAILVATAILTSVGLLYWLHDGDLHEAVEPVVEQWTQPETPPQAADDPSTL